MDKELFLKKIEAAENIAVIGHIRPDGDCVGSCLGMYNYIKDNYPDKKVVVFLEPIAPKFRFLKGSEAIKSNCDDSIYELAISLDCGDTDRHGQFAAVFQNAKDTICLDHHRSNKGFGDYYYCDPDASSTCEIIYRHIDSSLISRECAECLYLGIVHDTGVFKYPSTSQKTMEIAGFLISRGARSQYIIDETFFKVTYAQNKLTGEALLGSGLALDGKVIYTFLSRELFEKYGATKDDTDGIIDKLRVTEGVEVAIFAYDMGESIKYSLRSVSYVDVSKIAVSFGGGGHIRAAGFDVKGEFEEVLNRIISMVADEI